jgi:hypothetical protein
MLTVFNCEGLRIKGDVSLRAERVKLSPNRIIESLGEPNTIGVDISSPYSKKATRIFACQLGLKPGFSPVKTR